MSSFVFYLLDNKNILNKRSKPNFSIHIWFVLKEFCLYKQPKQEPTVLILQERQHNKTSLLFDQTTIWHKKAISFYLLTHTQLGNHTQSAN